MTLAVTSRAALGHTGRPLSAPTPVARAYKTVALAALRRFAGAACAPQVCDETVQAAGALRIAAFAIFAAAYAPVLTGPRAAARPTSGRAA
jgi:uncharacterized protein involved in response to NO